MCRLKPAKLNNPLSVPNSLQAGQDGDIGRMLASAFVASEPNVLPFPKIISGHIDDAARPRSEWQQ
jgi:hypothetical protein